MPDGRIVTKTTRGSASNGYVTRNLSHISGYKLYQKDISESEEKKEKKEHQARMMSQKLRSHEYTKQIENIVLEYEMELEDKGYDEKKIKELVQKKREQLQRSGISCRPQQVRNSHEKKLYSRKQHDRFARALYIDPESHVEGSAFAKMKPNVRKRKRDEKFISNETLVDPKGRSPSPQAKDSPKIADGTTEELSVNVSGSPEPPKKRAKSSVSDLFS